MLSIVIVNFRTWDHISRNLESLLPSLKDVPESSGVIEIVVVDNHSDDGQFKSFGKQYPQVKLMRSEGNFGYAHGCNQGAKAAKGDWLLFMNPDVVSDWKNLNVFWQYAIDHPEWHILTATQYDNKGRLQRSFAPFTRLSNVFPTVRILLRLVAPHRYLDPRTPPEQLAEVVDVDWVTGSLVLMHRSTFEKLNGWDEDFWLYCEDEDICKRANDKGMKTGYFTNARFIHGHASSTRSNPETKALTKSETILSKYLYLSKHEKNWQGITIQWYFRQRSYIAFPVWRTLEIMTIKKIPKIVLKSRIHRRLLDYYARAKKTGILLSERSINFRKHTQTKCLSRT